MASNDREQRIRVGILGYGVIGKRVADAVSLQADMQVSGVTDAAAEWRLRVGAQLGHIIYAAEAGAAEEMRTLGVPAAGNLDDLCRTSTV